MRISSFIPKPLLDKIKYWQSERIFRKQYNDFLINKETSEDGYQRLISLYCKSNGKFNEKFDQELKGGMLNLTDEKPGLTTPIKQVGLAEQLESEGYAILEKKLSADVIDRLKKFALTVPSVINYKTKMVYNPESSESEIYRFDAGDIINHEDVQNLIMDPELIQIAKSYLGCEPIFDFPAMWWSTSFSKEASADAAQLYHFDMDRIKWLKLFIYLTDVGDDNGPHCYIAKTHKVNSKPQNLLDRGYVRIPDSELKEIYPESDFKELHGDAGTIFVGDTKCWHKGKPLKSGHRLVLELQYTTSLFGINCPIPCSKPSQQFKEFIKKYSHYTSNIHIVDAK